MGLFVDKACSHPFDLKLKLDSEAQSRDTEKDGELADASLPSGLLELMKNFNPALRAFAYGEHDEIERGFPAPQPPNGLSDGVRPTRDYAAPVDRPLKVRGVVWVLIDEQRLHHAPLHLVHLRLFVKREDRNLSACLKIENGRLPEPHSEFKRCAAMGCAVNNVEHMDAFAVIVPGTERMAVSMTPNLGHFFDDQFALFRKA